MARVTMRETTTSSDTPTQAAVRAAGGGHITVTDALGRSITLGKPKPLENLDFTKACGSDKLNLLYLAEVAHLKFVREIDGERISTPSNDTQLRALYQRLSDEGNAAAQVGVSEHFMAMTEADPDAVKN